MGKKLIRIAFMVCIVLLLIPFNAFAADGYHIFVGSTEVTSENFQNITGPGITGKVSYDPEKQVLTLENAEITSYYTSTDTNDDGVTTNNVAGLSILNEEIETITVSFIGKNSIVPQLGDDITADSSSAIVSSGNLVLQADETAVIHTEAYGAKDNYTIMGNGVLAISGGTYMVKSGETSDGMSIGVFVGKDISCSASTKMDIRTGGATNSFGLLCAGNLEMNGSAHIVAGTASKDLSCGISCLAFTSKGNHIRIEASEAPNGISVGLLAESEVSLESELSKEITMIGYDFSLSTPALIVPDTDYWYANKDSVKPNYTEHLYKDQPIDDPAVYQYLRIISQDRLPVIPFDDVPRNAFFTYPVLWAVEEAITTGTSTTPPLFSPNTTCTRAQTVTFLWRAAGSPEPESKEMPFTDVKAGSFYYKAVQWAVENNITKGMTATTFEPDTTVSRGQVVTFLWRTQNEPETSTQTNPFTDVAENAFYTTPVFWAVENGITNGMSPTAFEPDRGCTRGQIVTFLWRAAGEPEIS